MPPDSLVVTDDLAIPMHELDVRASRAGGPGGQHVNTSSTRIEVTWNIPASAVLDDTARARLLARLASRLDTAGTLRVVASDRRSQLQNREAALARMAEVVARALAVPKPRRKTRVPRAAKARRLEAKRRRGEVKSRRKPVRGEE